MGNHSLCRNWVDWPRKPLIFHIWVRAVQYIIKQLVAQKHKLN